MPKTKILLIYTGGTIGMVQDLTSNSLKPFNFSQIKEQVPELKRFNFQIETHSFNTPIDSSNMHPRHWVEMVSIIEKNYLKYDGFVILHGSDTMAYTASALSYMLENLQKPVILTGSQLPIGVIRTDGKENLITAIEIAAAKEKGKPVVQEVAVYFEYQLLRGNRTTKYNSEYFDAFISPNYPKLAEAGININYNNKALYKPQRKSLKTHKKFDNDIATLKLFPGFSRKISESILFNTGIKAIVLETYGSGNAPMDDWFIEALSTAVKKGKIIVNITQCPEGRVIQGKYETSSLLKKIGIVSGNDLTFEAGVTKLMYLLANYKSTTQIKKLFEQPLRGELTIY